MEESDLPTTASGWRLWLSSSPFFKQQSSGLLQGPFDPQPVSSPTPVGSIFQLYHFTDPVDLAHTVTEDDSCQHGGRKQGPGVWVFKTNTRNKPEESLLCSVLFSHCTTVGWWVPALLSAAAPQREAFALYTVSLCF